MKPFVLNPILEKEFRSRMRTWKSALIVSLYPGILALIILGYYWIKQKNPYYGFGPDIGPQIYIILTMLQLLLVAFITPAFTASIINGERERQTFDLLTCTPLSAASIVVSKLFASISYILLLIIASLPVFGIVYFFGGVLLSEIGRGFVIYLVTALTFGTIGIFCSAVFKRTQVSIIVTYIAVFFFLVGTIIIAFFWQGINEGSYRMGIAGLPLIIYLNPLIALYSMFPVYGVNSSWSEIWIRLFNRSDLITANGVNMLEPWQYNFIMNGILILILLIVTIIIIDPVGRFAWLRNWRRKDLPGADVKEELTVDS